MAANTSISINALTKGTANAVLQLLGYNAPGDGGEGELYWDNTSTETANGGTIFQVPGVPVGRWKRKYSPDFINMSWFGVDKTGALSCSTQYNIAKTLIAPTGGTIYFPRGVYMSNSVGSNSAVDPGGYFVHRDNIIIQGDGINATILMTPDNTNTPGMQVSPYRQEGWIRTPSLVYTYENTMNTGQGYVDIKTGNESILSSLTPGTKIFINAGGSYYDQHYGDFNIVSKVVGNRVYLKKHLNRNYSYQTSSSASTLTADFTPPAVGSTAVASIATPVPIVANSIISLANDLYEITAVSGNNVTLRNLGKGNGTAVIPSGTPVFKSRCIFLTPSTSINVQVRDLTIYGHRKGIIISNSMDVKFDNVRIIRQPGTTAGGWWIDGDDGRDAILRDCFIESELISGSQMARSFSGFTMENCQLHQCLLEISEFNVNFDIIRNKFYAQKGTGDDDRPPVNVGQSTSNINIIENYIDADGMSSAISSSDIQGYTAISGGNITIRANKIRVNNVDSAISIQRSGSVDIDRNEIEGSCNSIFGGTNGYSYGVNNTRDVNGRYVTANRCRITNNTFAGYSNSVLTRDPTNIYVEGNYFNMHGDYTPGGNATANARGNIIYGQQSGDKGIVEQLVFRNNTFKNWRYNQNSFNPTGVPNARWDISNNRFIDARSTYRQDKDFVITTQDEEATNFGSINYMASVKSKDLDLATYLNYVKLAGGVISSSELAAIQTLLTQIYDNDLRDKIILLYPFAGDQNASRVPILGWDKTIYKAFAQNTLTNYSSSVGWKGGSNTFGILAKGTEIDVTNAGLFVQVTDPPTTTSATFIGRRNAGNTGSRFELLRGTTTVTGISGTTIVTGYTPSNGFIATSQMAVAGVTSQTNFINTTNNTASNTNAGTAQRNEYSEDIYLLANSDAGGSLFSDAAIGACGITKYLTVQETQLLRTIIYNLMVSLGRPVQTGTITALPAYGVRSIREYYRTDYTAAKTDAELNSDYPGAPQGTIIYAKNTAGGGVSYKKDDTTNNTWIRQYFTNSAPPANQSPTVTLEPNRTINTNNTTLVASANDPDGSIQSVQWTKQSGPQEPTGTGFNQGSFTPLRTFTVNGTNNDLVINSGTYQAGDLIQLTGTFRSITLNNVEGAAGNPVVFRNIAGQTVNIGNPTWAANGGPSYAIEANNSRYICFAGTHWENFIINGSDINTDGGGEPYRSAYRNISLDSFTECAEFCYMTINDGGTSFVAKTDPVAGNSQTWHTSGRELGYLWVHDIINDNAYNEAFYIGHTASYWDIQAIANTTFGPYDAIPDPTRYKQPILWNGVKLWNNKVTNCGKDGIQLSGIKNGEIYNNEVTNWANVQHNAAHNGGILCGGRTFNMNIHDNVVHDGWGELFQFYGIGPGHLLTNNLFYNTDASSVSGDMASFRGLKGTNSTEDNPAQITVTGNTFARCGTGGSLVRVNGYLNRSGGVSGTENMQVILNRNMSIAPKNNTVTNPGDAYPSYYVYTENEPDYDYNTIVSKGTGANLNQEYNTLQSANVDTANFYLPNNGAITQGYRRTSATGPQTIVAGSTIMSPTTLTTQVTGMISGVYTFRCTVTDNAGATAAANIQVTVNL